MLYFQIISTERVCTSLKVQKSNKFELYMLKNHKISKNAQKDMKKTSSHEIGLCGKL